MLENMTKTLAIETAKLSAVTTGVVSLIVPLKQSMYHHPIDEFQDGRVKTQDLIKNKLEFDNPEGVGNMKEYVTAVMRCLQDTAVDTNINIGMGSLMIHISEDEVIVPTRVGGGGSVSIKDDGYTFEFKITDDDFDIAVDDLSTNKYTKDDLLGIINSNISIEVVFSNSLNVVVVTILCSPVLIKFLDDIVFHDLQLVLTEF